MQLMVLYSFALPPGAIPQAPLMFLILIVIMIRHQEGDKRNRFHYCNYFLNDVGVLVSLHLSRLTFFFICVKSCPTASRKLVFWLLFKRTFMCHV